MDLLSDGFGENIREIGDVDEFVKGAYLRDVEGGEDAINYKCAVSAEKQADWYRQVAETREESSAVDVGASERGFQLAGERRGDRGMWKRMDQRS